MDQPKIERVLRLMKMMAGNNNYTVEDMAERLGISYRSVYRYIETFKDSGFVVHRKDGGIYKLGKESRYFKEISQLIHFTDEEAHIVNQLIEGVQKRKDESLSFFVPVCYLSPNPPFCKGGLVFGLLVKIVHKIGAIFVYSILSLSLSSVE